MTVDVGNQLGGCFVDGLKARTKLFQFLVLRPGGDIAEAVFTCSNTIIGTNGKRNAFGFDLLGVAVFSLFISETVSGNLTADKVQTFLLSKGQPSIFAKVKGLGCNNRTGVIDSNVVFHRDRLSWVIVRATQVIDIHSFGNGGRVNATVGEQTGYIENLDLLILFGIFRLFDFILIVELGVCDFVDDGRDRLHFSHTLTDGNLLIILGKIAVCVIRNRLEFNRHGRGTPQGFHKDLIVLYITL